MSFPPLKVLGAASLFAAAFVLNAGAQSATVAVTAGTPVRVVDERVFGMNTPFWDSTFTNATSLDALTQMGTRVMRFGGGSATDEYDWSTNKDIVSNDTWAFNIDGFAAQAQAIRAQAIITTNYGSGTPAAAAAYVTYANVTKGYGFKYWEIGNECYGTWEYDVQTSPHDPYTYGMRAAQYITAMRAADPSIKIGVVAPTGEDSYAVGYTSHPATNPRTNTTHNGWTPVMLATMKAAGVLPDFLIYHRYEQNPGQENDAVLLQDALTWPADAANLRQMLTDYLGAAGAGIELLVTENNSVNSSPGKQSVSLVNGLYMADSAANIMQTEFNSLLWWAFDNGQTSQSTSSPINLSSSLYGWRDTYGDYGVQAQATNDRYPTFYIAKLLSHFARGGDTVVKTTSSANLVSAYSVKRQDGSLSVLLINKSPTATYSVNVGTTGFTPGGAATVYSYGMPQDNAAKAAAAASTPASGGTVLSSWENDMDGWANQSGPNDAADNYGLDAPFAFASSFSTLAGVTDGSSSLSMSDPGANPGYTSILQNSTTAMATALSTAQTVSFTIFPQETGTGAYANAGIYFNGSGFSAYFAYPLTSLHLNQSNTVTFALTDAQRASIVASMASGGFFQVGIIVQANAPVTAFLDSFSATYASGSNPTPPPVDTAAEDIAVTTMSGVGTSFTISVAPYSATVVSVQGPASAPVSASQPTSVTVASGRTATFSLPATGGPDPTFQWSLNGSAIAGATSSTLVVSGATSANAGNYTCTATNASGSITSSPASLTVVTTADPGRLINLSCRAEVGTGANIVFAGFAIGPATLSGNESVLIRASGPAIALPPFNVGGTLKDPQLQLFNANLLQTNNGWAGNATIASTASAVHAFPWSDPTSHDSAFVTALPAGPYTAQVAGQSGDTGDALAEVYDATPAGTYTLSTPRLVNLSARVSVGTGSNALIAGFVIGGSSSMTVLIRASGPALSEFSISGFLPDPKLILQDSTGATLQTNNSWGGDSVIASVAAGAGAFQWLDPNGHDSAILVTLPPGAYTANVSGASGDTGVSLVEVYEIQ